MAGSLIVTCRQGIRRRFDWMTLATRDGRESFCLFVCFFTGEDESAAEVEPRNFTKLGPELVQVSARLGDDSFDTLDFFLNHHRQHQRFRLWRRPRHLRAN